MAGDFRCSHEAAGVTVSEAIRTALDDCRIRLGPRAHTAFVDRLAELIELDRQQRHQTRRDAAANAPEDHT